MSATSPTTATAEEKARKQKRLLAVLSVVLLGIVGFQLPKLLGGNPVAATTAPSVVEPAPATGEPGAVAGGGAAGAKLPDTDRVVIEPQSGQLVSFGLFKSKDPFVQQLSTVASPLTPTTPTTATEPLQSPFSTTPAATTPTQTTPSGPQQGRSTITGRVTPLTTTTTATPAPTSGATLALPTTPAATTPAAPAPATPAATGTTPGSTTPASTTPASKTGTSTTPAAAAPAPTSVAISTNGACEVVQVKGTFPGSEDIFRVVSIAKDGKSVKIGVVGGAYDSGQGAATLKQGEKLTLVNTAEGTRYVLLLKPECEVDTQPATQPSPATTTTTAGTTTAVAPPPSSATTPIVTDSLDTTTPGG
jgi:hypothetical protein